MKYSQTFMTGAIQKSPNSAKVTTHSAEVKDQSSKMHEADIPTTSENVSLVDL